LGERCFALEPADSQPDSDSRIIMIPNQSQQKLAFYMSTILSDFATSVLRELASQLALVRRAACSCHGSGAATAERAGRNRGCVRARRRRRATWTTGPTRGPSMETTPARPSLTALFVAAMQPAQNANNNTILMHNVRQSVVRPPTECGQQE